MTQISRIRVASKEKGAKRTIKLPAIATGALKQYTKDHDKLRDVIREYGSFNQISILNNGAIDIEIALDFTANKTYPIPANSSISLDEIMFQGFNVVNIDAATTVVNKITIVATYEPPLERERLKTFKQLGGR